MSPRVNKADQTWSVWRGTDECCDAGDERGARAGDGHAIEDRRSHCARCGSAAIVADARGWIFQHDAGRPLRVTLHKLRVDTLARERVENAIAGRIRAEPAHPRGVETETRQADRRIALGTRVIDHERVRVVKPYARRRGEREHRLSEREQIMRFCR